MGFKGTMLTPILGSKKIRTSVKLVDLGIKYLSITLSWKEDILHVDKLLKIY